MKSKRNRRSGQTMVEYIIIVVLVAVALLVLFNKFGGAVGKKVAGATSAIDDEKGREAATIAEQERDIKTLGTDGTFH